MRNIVSKINRMPLIAAFLLYQFLIVVRIYMEMRETMPAIFIMQLFWFDCVLMFFVISFKYLLKLKNADLSVLAFGGFLTYIPMIYSFLMNHEWKLNFINLVSFKQVVFNMLTLLAVHEYDWPMFPELVLLVLSSFIVGTVLTGKRLKPLVAALLATYSSFFCLGFSWVAVNPNHPSFLHFTSGFADHVFYSLYYILFFSVLCLIAFWKEIIDFVGKIEKKPLAAALFAMFLVLGGAAFFIVFKRKLHVIDFIMLSASLAAFPATVLCAWKRAWKYMFTPFWILLLSVILFVSR